MGSPSHKTPSFPRARPTRNRSGRSVCRTCGKTLRGVPARRRSRSPAASTAGTSSRTSRAFSVSSCSGRATPSKYNTSTRVFVSVPSVVSQSLSVGVPARRRRRDVFTRRLSTNASFAPRTLFSTVGASTPRFSPVFTSKVSAALSPSKTSAAYPAAMSAQASAADVRLFTGHAQTPPASASDRSSRSLRARSAASGRTISPAICPALTHPSRKKRTTEMPPGAESVRRSRSAQFLKDFSIAAEKSRRGGTGSERRKSNIWVVCPEENTIFSGRKII